MDVVTAYTSEDEYDNTEAYLTFTTLFYTKDKQGWMRLISRSEGIYPNRLRFMADVKREVDSLYPFGAVGIRFGFPLLREFLSAPKSEGWYKDLASVLGSIFTGGPLNKRLLYKAVARKIQQSGRDEVSLETIADLSFKGLNLVEYVEHLEQSGRRGGSP